MGKTQLLNTPAVAAKLGFTRDYVRRMCQEGMIRAIKVGTDWLIDEKDIKHIVRRRKSKKDLDNGTSE
jgi:excisionase family DNA binding protein